MTEHATWMGAAHSKILNHRGQTSAAEPRVHPVDQPLWEKLRTRHVLSRLFPDVPVADMARLLYPWLRAFAFLRARDRSTGWHEFRQRGSP